MITFSVAEIIASKGDLEMLQWLDGIRWSRSFQGLYEAFQNGHVHILDYYHQPLIRHMGHLSTDVPADEYAVKLYEWFHSRLPDIDWKK